MIADELGVERDRHRKAGVRYRNEEVGSVRRDHCSVDAEVGCS